MKIFLLLWLLIEALTVVAKVGKPREPITPQLAAMSVFLAALIGTGIILWL